MPGKFLLIYRGRIIELTLADEVIKVLKPN